MAVGGLLLLLLLLLLARCFVGGAGGLFWGQNRGLWGCVEEKRGKKGAVLSGGVV